MAILKLEAEDTMDEGNDMESKQDPQSEFEAQIRAIWALISQSKVVLARIDEKMKGLRSLE
jgi:hypothetical protein